MLCSLHSSTLNNAMLNLISMINLFLQTNNTHAPSYNNVPTEKPNPSSAKSLS